MLSNILGVFTYSEDGQHPLWATIVGCLGIYGLSQGYFECGRPPDPSWGTRAALFVSDKRLPSSVPMEKWGGNVEAKLLRESVSRAMKHDGQLRNVFVVRDKSLAYFLMPRRGGPNPLPRPNLSGFPLIFCGHVTAQGKSYRFSYIPQQQEIIVLGLSPKTHDLARDEWARVRSDRLVEKEYQRICGRSLERIS